jgi:hypothetical protein
MVHPFWPKLTEFCRTLAAAQELLPVQKELTKLTKPAKGGYRRFRRLMRRVNTGEFSTTRGRNMRSPRGLGRDVTEASTRFTFVDAMGRVHGKSGTTRWVHFRKLLLGLGFGNEGR